MTEATPYQQPQPKKARKGPQIDRQSNKLNVSPLRCLRARDQFAALMMLTHPRCCAGAGANAVARDLAFCCRAGGGVGFACRLVWDHCHDSGATRLFCLSFAGKMVPASAVVTFAASPLLCSLTSEAEVWLCGTVMRSLYAVNARNMVTKSVNKTPPAYHLRGIGDEDTRERCLVDGAYEKKCSCNGKWFVCCPKWEPRSLVISNIWENIQQGRRVTCEVTFPKITGDWRCGFFCNQFEPDEGILYIDQHELAFDLKVVQIEQTWTTKELRVVSSTRLPPRSAFPDRVKDILMLQKKSGSRAFIIISALASGGLQICQAEETSTSTEFILRSSLDCACITQLSNSQFCVWASPPQREPPYGGVLEIWDINSTDTGPLRLVTCHDNCITAHAQGGLLFNAMRYPPPSGTGSGVYLAQVEVTDPHTGTGILTLSYDYWASVKPLFSLLLSP